MLNVVHKTDGGFYMGPTNQISGDINVNCRPILIVGKEVDLKEIEGYNNPSSRKPVIFLLEGSNMDNNKFSYFTSNITLQEGGKFTDHQIEAIFKAIKEAEIIGIKHGKPLGGGVFPPHQTVEFAFSEDDPKKYLRAFMEFAAYGGEKNDPHHQAQVEAYYKSLSAQFPGKFPDQAPDQAPVFDEYKRILEEEEGISEKKSIYNGKHKFEGKIIKGRLHIKYCG